MNQSQVSRRNFLKGAGMLTGAAALAAMTGCAPNGGEAAATVTSENIEWDHEADVIVCGGGGGLLAACDAADAGQLGHPARKGGVCRRRVVRERGLDQRFGHVRAEG